MMKRIFTVSVLVLACVSGLLAGPRREQGAQSAELVVFAAASMTEAMNEIAELYKAAAPEVNIVYNFDSSGTLKTQIQQGAPCDIFISAGQLQMNQLDISADPGVNTDQLDFVLQGSRFNIVSNQVVLIVPQGSTKGISDFRDILTDKVSLAAIGNSDVPVGQYSQEIYTNLGLWDALRNSGKITYGSNVKEVLSHVESAAVDCGIVYGTDAATAQGVLVVAQAPAGSHRPITYPAAILNVNQNQAAAEAFVAFLKGPQARAVFERIGFAIPAN
ncbi:MAG: molybdate ABC transporter substrate-binding protein [Spirochaetales bacterium]|nr:molybdate ABC transporter substrate-binding protein [Spirochaetales bacterium]